MLIAMELNGMLPASEVPEHTDAYEGFFHLSDITGTVENTTLNYLIRDHDMKNFNKKKDQNQLSVSYGGIC